jgi:hypothetical protein
LPEQKLVRQQTLVFAATQDQDIEDCVHAQAQVVLATTPAPCRSGGGAP